MKVQVYIEADLAKNNSLKGKLRPIYLICTEQGKRFWLNTQIMVSRKFKGREIPKTESNYKVKQVTLNGYLQKIEEYELLHQDNSWARKKEDIMAMFGKDEIIRKSRQLIYAIKEYAAQKPHKGTRGRYITLANWVEAYDGEVLYPKVDSVWIEHFYTHMTTNNNEGRKGVNNNTAIYNLNLLKAVFEWLIDEDKLSRNPFRKYKFPKKDMVIRNYLGIEDIRAIRDYDAPTAIHQKYLDLFMLSFYLCGLSEIDILTMTDNDVQNRRLVKKRHKTGTLINIPICPAANKIIRKYKGKTHLIDLIERNPNPIACENVWLRGIAKIGNEIGIPKLKVRDARSAFASIAASIGCSQEDIALCLAHNWANVTAKNYIGWDYTRVDKVLNKVLKAIAD